MADLDEKFSSQAVKVVGADTDGLETNYVKSNTIGEIATNDTPQQGVSTVLTLTTTAQELKVGGSALTNRKLIEMQALDKNVKWSYNINCDFDLFKNQFFALPCGENCTLYLKASTGTADVAVSEK